MKRKAAYMQKKPVRQIPTKRYQDQRISNAVVHDFVKEFTDRSISITVGWTGSKLPHGGANDGSLVTAAPTPKVPARK